MGQMSLLGISVALLLLINTIGATLIPHRELRLNSDRYSESSEARAADEDYRLPQAVTPTKYTITLQPDYSNFATFTGEVEITVQAITNTKSISLHYDKINIESRTVTDLNGKEFELDDDNDNSYNETTNIYTLTLKSDELTAKELYRINIQYNGQLLDDMAGFYRSSYTTADGEKR
jgi:hypothetical protein